MNIFLSGSGGFIGKNLKEFLSAKQDVHKLLSPRSSELDLRDEEAVKLYFEVNDDINLIIHCASVGGAREIQDPPTTIRDNLTMVDNILKYKNSNCRVILFSSGAMYDKSKSLQKVEESVLGIFKPLDWYGKSKMLIAQKVKGMKDILCLNIFACYGYGEKESRFPSYAINKSLKGETIEINQNVFFDYLFVEDMASLVYEFAKQEEWQGNIVNLTPDESVDLLTIANIINKIADKKVPIIIKQANLGHEYSGSNSLLTQLIKDFQFTPLEQGISKLYQHIKSAKE